MAIHTGKPPKNTLRVNAWLDLPAPRTAAIYSFKDSIGNDHTITVDKNRRRVLEGLMLSPIYCASMARLSCYVAYLRHCHGLNIETIEYKGEGQPLYGVYFLRSNVSPQVGEV